jgi:hypothetical protein
MLSKNTLQLIFTDDVMVFLWALHCIGREHYPCITCHRRGGHEYGCASDPIYGN